MHQHRYLVILAEQWRPCLFQALALLSAHRNRCVVAVGVFLALFVTASAIASLGDRSLNHAHVSGKKVTLDVALPDLEQQIRQLEQQDQVFVTEERLRSSDNIGNLLLRLGATDPTALQFIRTHPLASRLLKSRAGTDISARIDDDGQLLSLRFPLPFAADAAQILEPRGARLSTMLPSSSPDRPITRKSFVVIDRVGDRFRATEQTLELERRVEYRSGTIQTSLFAATDKAGVPDEVVRHLADIFEGELDFHFNLRKGDAFRVVYETYHSQGRYGHTGRVLSAEIINRGRAYHAVWFETSPGRGSYYNLNGRSLKSSFLRTPLQYSRVSSGFSDSRLHPIHMRWRAHTGVDYAAPTGTPVRSVADGVVTFAGWQNGYGNVIFIKHSGSYSTVYAHLSRISPNARKGARVSQGQFIGEVGATGWATGPHLHYEVRINNVPQNPLTVALPSAAPIDRQLKPAFMAHVEQTRRQLALLSIAPVALR
jgi:murein DD-endopeptidase MepM/ murein hydrolase activator NlpD